ISLSSEERSLYSQLFRSLDVSNSGVISGDVARTLLERSGLSPLVLGRIWQIADAQNNGFLNHNGFAVALRLIGHVQNGQRLVPELAAQPGPLPRFSAGSSRVSSISGPQPPAAVIPQPNNNAVIVPPLALEDRARYVLLFTRSTSESLMSGAIAHDIFINSQLSNTVLDQIWNLSDIHRRGSLDLTEFVIAMHLIQCTRNHTLLSLPASVPQSLFTAAAAVHERPSSRASVASASSVPLPQLPPPSNQLPGHVPSVRTRGAYASGTQSPAPGQISRAATADSTFSGSQSTPPLGPPARVLSMPVQEEWLVSPQQKEQFDAIFASVDKEHAGFIGGDVAVPFFMTSNLPEDDLAHIWDLADIRNSGSLSKDEFAVAMYLVHQRLAGQDLPPTLPAALVPLSMRSGASTSAATGPQSNIPSSGPVPSAPSGSALLDLVDLNDAFSSPATSGPSEATPSIASPGPSYSTSASPPPATRAVPFGSSAISGTVPKPLTPSLTGRAPFKPSSAFGQSLAQGTTSPSDVPSLPSTAPVSPPSIQATPEPVQPTITGVVGYSSAPPSQPVPVSSVSTAPLSGEITTMTSQTQSLKDKRAKAEGELSKMVLLRTDIEGKLKQLRGVYESEVIKVRTVEQQLAVSSTETAKLRQEHAELEASLSSIQTNYQEVMASLEADQSENAALKEKLKLLKEQTAQIQESCERAKDEARQHKGMAAINKQMIINAESDLERARSELSAAQLEASSAAAEAVAISRAPVSASVYPSTARSMTASPSNPF
ncbi:uncharacterized protein V1516DRAFT_604030, partial [Lipomyces oligophaga]|uniref:uncharacterized protein n=1 Tax=Lipomyces oligophaga TaxID=45792 RepID=UPI0034CF295B